MEKKLSVRNLTISFRTSNGKVQAVRGIDFDLHKGETLAIVGESGSGKSVTSKAILGILAGNSIVENGEIIYDGKDLLKISEEDFHKLRGDKIAMIFQDPMSSLNPIVKIGRQLTEAMILKGKVRQRESRAAFNRKLKLLRNCMVAATPAAAQAIEEKCKAFDKFEYKHIELESAFNKAYEAAVEAVGEIEGLALEVEKNAAKDIDYRVKRVSRLAKASVQEYVVKEDAAALTAKADHITALIGAAKKGNGLELAEELRQISEILTTAINYTAPNFFALGYFKTFASEPLPEMAVTELNQYLRTYLDERYMLDFIVSGAKGLKWSAEKSNEAKAVAIQTLNEHRAVFTKAALERAECMAAHKAMAEAVEKAIDQMEIVKDSMAYTFNSALKSEIEKYFAAIGKNAREEKRFAAQKDKYDKLVARHKTPEWEVVPKSLTDLTVVQGNILREIDQMVQHYQEAIEGCDARNFENEMVGIIDYLKENASAVVHKVTKGLAKEKAIKLMEEVGIPEPRKRFNQYPFEFSGGMRQRIVIAIALAADPDILICDEPTTALDVSIQSQILELINRVKEQRKLSVIFITHDLGVVANMANRIAVMYAGKIVEIGTAEDVFYRSAHPYTWALLSSMPDLDTKEKLDAIPGTPPNMIYPPKGDAFAERNKYAMKIDFEMQPPMFKITDSHYAATWLLHPDAPKVEVPKIIQERIARMNAKRGVEHAE